MGAYCGSIAARLQDGIDRKHSAELGGHGDTIKKVNYQLRHIIQELKVDFTKKLHERDESGKELKTFDLTEYVEKFNELREIYHEYMVSSSENLDGKDIKIPELFSGDLGEVSKADLEKILQKIGNVETGHKDTVTDITQKLYLIGQLFITITDILRKMDEGHRRGMERIAERTGSR